MITSERKTVWRHKHRQEQEQERGRGDFQLLGRGAAFLERPPVVKDRAKQTVNYPDNTGERGKRRVNETLIRSQFESFGSVIP